MYLAVILAALAVSVHGCGQRNLFPGVVAGQTAQPHSWPWQIQLTKSGRHFCGGSLLSENWVVTAAHCVTTRSGQPQSPRGLKIRLGGHRRSGYEQGSQNIGASQIIVHERYSQLKNDIALIRLSSPAKLSKTVNTVCLPSHGQRASAGGKCYITGWGRTLGGGSLASELQQAMMPIIADSTCESVMSRLGPNYDTNVMVCAGVKNNPVSGCQGDSGGPFVCEEGGRYVLRGAVSWGDQNCKAGTTFTAFARISTFVNWINSKTGGINPNPPPTPSTNPPPYPPTNPPNPPTNPPNPPTNPPNPNCVDNDPNGLCAIYRSLCGGHHWWVKKNCKKTCGVC